MTPQIALDLSLDGIAVLSRAPADGPDRGRWYREGVVRLDAPDMAQRLRVLRDRCAERHGDDLVSILVIPQTQILFTSVERDDRDARTTIRSQLDGRTPYAVADLAFDHVVRGDRLQVAVVALDTLMEAETFAADFGFAPVALVAEAKPGTFDGLADFGQTGIARDLLAGERLSLDLERGFEVIDRPPEGAEPARDAVEPSAPTFAELVATPPPPTPVPPKPAVPADAPPRAGSGAACPSPPPGPALPPPSPPPAAEPPPQRTEPSFSSRRKVVPPAEPASDEPPAPRLPPARIAYVAKADPPPPKDEAEAIDDAEDGAGATPPPGAAPPPSDPPRRPAALAGVDAALRAPVTPPRSAATRRLAELAARIRPTGDAPGDGPPPPRASPMAADGALSEAQALALPGEGRATPKRRGAARTGLVLTLSLLAALLAVAIWAALSAPGERTLDDAPPVVEPVVRSSVEPPAAAPGRTAELPAPEEAAALDGERAAAAAATAPVADAPPDTTVRTTVTIVEITPAEGGASGEATPEDGAPAAADIAAAEPGPAVEAPALDPDPVLATFSSRGAIDAPPALAAPPSAAEASEIYTASIDPVVADGDAVALPPGAVPVDAFSPQTSPAPAGTAFDTGGDGLVVATAEGALAPGGYRVVAGRPDPMPSARPPAEAAEAQEAADPGAVETLRRIRPIARPVDADERVERIGFAGLTRDEITRVRPTARPASVEAAAASSAAQAAVAEVVEEEQIAAIQAAAAAAAASLARPGLSAVDPTGEVSRYALARSERPGTRPRSVERDAARIVTARREAAASAPAAQAAPQPSRAAGGQQTIRSAGGSVSRAATEANAIRLREINLIGVYGRPSDRRALVRLSNGRYVKVKVGDQLDRGRVVAIGDAEVVYQRRGQNVALRMPST